MRDDVQVTVMDRIKSSAVNANPSQISLCRGVVLSTEAEIEHRMRRGQRKLVALEVREAFRMQVKSWLDITAKDLLKASLINYRHA